MPGLSRLKLELRRGKKKKTNQRNIYTNRARHERAGRMKGGPIAIVWVGDEEEKRACDQAIRGHRTRHTLMGRRPAVCGDSFALATREAGKRGQKKRGSIESYHCLKTIHGLKGLRSLISSDTWGTIEREGGLFRGNRIRGEPLRASASAAEDRKCKRGAI